MTRFHRSVPGFAVTPIHDLPEVASGLGIAGLGIKDESGRCGLPSFKALGAFWATHRALCRALHLTPHGTSIDALRLALPSPPPLLVTASMGNHGRAVARIGKLLGARVRVFLPEHCSSSKADRIAAEGAEIERIAGTFDDAVHTAAAVPDALLIQDHALPGNYRMAAMTVEGYRTLFREVLSQAAPPDAVFVPTGVGGLLAAAATELRRSPAGRGTRLIAVEPEASACAQASVRAGAPVAITASATSMHCLDCPTVSAASWSAIRDGVDQVLTISETEACDARKVLAQAGIRTGSSGIAGFAGLRALQLSDSPDRLTPGDRALVVVTEGIERPVPGTKPTHSPPPPPPLVE